MNNNNLCNNCGKTGHISALCKLPIASYGIICCRIINNKYEYLMIRRKDTFGFIDFIRGKYNLKDIDQIQNIIDQMSNDEKMNIISNSYNTLLTNMWGENIGYQQKNEEQSASRKFQQLIQGVSFKNSEIKLVDIVNNSNTNWSEPEWEFPKGRKNINEKDYDCAIREFEEETGILRDNIDIVSNLLPFTESFIGTNYKSYKHKYFLAIIKDSQVNLSNYQATEVSKLEWKSYINCIEDIRPYNVEKIKLIEKINNVLENNVIISI